ncbi:hypothetical protein [Cupriavidus sp. BIS7]|uniref:hypothetical protein n=1 Tax=Cupriavidus sp. BIS7 TaxID=1217718 RepID=UPI0012F6C19C|nr:hypothetical protein [Cupriavidus sp. BIS7]
MNALLPLNTAAQLSVDLQEDSYAASGTPTREPAPEARMNHRNHRQERPSKIGIRPRVYTLIRKSCTREQAIRRKNS